jgi:hypothetical protein
MAWDTAMCWSSSASDDTGASGASGSGAATVLPQVVGTPTARAMSDVEEE